MRYAARSMGSRASATKEHPVGMRKRSAREPPHLMASQAQPMMGKEFLQTGVTRSHIDDLVIHQQLRGNPSHSGPVNLLCSTGVCGVLGEKIWARA